MSNIPKLGYTLDRFNQGCSFFQQAINAWRKGDFFEYETALRKAATEAIGALEWALKVYLRSICRGRIATEDKPKLKHPNFDDLMTLMQKYADPPLETETVSLLYDYRILFRNAAEHNAAVPPSEELSNAIQKVRQVVLAYLPVEEDQLKTVSMSITPDGAIQDLKAEYFKALRSRYKYMDLGGISPRVGSKVVKIPLEALFIPLQATEEEPLFESFSEELLEEVFESSEGFPLISEKIEELNGLSEIEILDSSQLEAPEEIIRMRRHPIGPRLIEMIHIFEKPRVVVLGHPGSGKTTVGKYVAYSIATAKVDSIGEHLGRHVPVMVKAAEYALSLREEPGLSFYDYVTRKHTTKFGSLFEWALQSGLCLMIIDGLDEIPEAQLRITTSRRIEQFVSEFQANRFFGNQPNRRLQAESAWRGFCSCHTQ